MEKTTNTIKRIALIGPESTGKSTLSKELALHYNTECVEEYSRTYLKGISRKYEGKDILNIAKLQLKQEQNQMARANKYIFIDTELIIAKVWYLDVFKTCPEWIYDNIITNKYDLYLLMYPDIEWESDEFRENPNRREFLFNWYKKELNHYMCDYTIIKGEGKKRLQNCINAIEKDKDLTN